MAHEPTSAADFPPFPPGRYTTIVADPPWMYSYSTRTTETPGTGWHGAVERHYPTMPYEEIAKLPVQALAADDAILWLWVVNPLLSRGIELAARWGFEYKGLLTWAKTQKNAAYTPFFGMGYWLRGATEHVVLATRGKPKPAVADQVSWFCAPVREHSRKPNEAYRIFERYDPNGQRIDLFARQQRPGWAAWGNEVSAPAVAANPAPRPDVQLAIELP